MNILVVDDHPPNRVLPSAILRKLGHVVHEAIDGPAALAAITAHPEITHLLLDISMPGMSGLEVCRTLRALPGGTRLRIVAYTAHAYDHEQEAIRSAGFDVVLVKPVNRAALVGALGLEATPSAA